MVLCHEVVVTGASGKAGRAAVHDLLEHDYDVLAVDLVPPREQLAPFLAVDRREMGQTVECLALASAVIHLAAIPAGGIRTEHAQDRPALAAATQLPVDWISHCSPDRVARQSQGAGSLGFPRTENLARG